VLALQLGRVPGKLLGDGHNPSEEPSDDGTLLRAALTG